MRGNELAVELRFTVNSRAELPNEFLVTAAMSTRCLDEHRHHAGRKCDRFNCGLFDFEVSQNTEL